MLVLLRFCQLGNTAPWVNRKIYSQISHFTTFTSLHSHRPLTHPLRLCPDPPAGAGLMGHVRSWLPQCRHLKALSCEVFHHQAQGMDLVLSSAYVPVRHLISLAPRIGLDNKTNQPWQEIRFGKPYGASPGTGQAQARHSEHAMT